MSSFNWPSSGGGGVQTVTVSPVGAAVGSAWFLYTPAQAFTQLSMILTAAPSGGMVNMVPGSSGELLSNFTGLTSGDISYLATLGITQVGGSMTIATDNTQPPGTTATSGTITVGGSGLTFAQMIASLNAWVVANFHAGIGTVWSASVPADLSLSIANDGELLNVSTNYTVEGVSLVFQGASDTYSIALVAD